MRAKNEVSVLFTLGVLLNLFAAAGVAQVSKPSEVAELYPALPVSEIRFTGAKNVAADELLARLRGCLGDPNKAFDERLYEYCSRRHVRNLMFSHGYFKAKIKSITGRQVGESYKVTIDIEEGGRYRWGTTRVQGQTVFSDSEVRAMLANTPGDIADGEKLQNVLFEQLKQTYAERGYVQYAVEFDPTFTEAAGKGSDGTVDVSITIEEGIKFSVGKIIFSGAGSDAEKTLRPAMQIKTGDVYDESKLAADIETINKMQLFTPVNQDRDVEIRTHEESGVVDLVIILKKAV